MVSEAFLRKIKSYIEKSTVLQEISDEQKSLRPPVNFRQRKKRVDKLLQIRDEGKKILENLSREKNVPKKLLNKVKSIVQRVDHMKRENCLLQLSGPLGVLKPHELCIFREKSRNNMIEVRKYFCLHKKLFYDDGLCVSIAHTKPKLLQNYHTHDHINEYTTVLSGSIVIKAKIGKHMKTIKASEGDIILAKKFTVHTLQNNSAKDALNATVKIPIGFKDRANIDELPKNPGGEIHVIKPKTRKQEWGELKHKTVKENGLVYRISIMTIKPSKSLKLLNKQDMGIYVVQGNVQVTGSKNKKTAKKNYLIFTRENCVIKNLSKKNTAKLYSVVEKK